MICDKLTASNILDAISEVMTTARKKYKEDSPELMKAQEAMNRVRAAVAKEVRLDDLFEQNLNNTSQLDVVVAAEPIVNAIQKNLQEWMKKMVSGSNIQGYDTFVNRLDQTGKGFQSVVELLFTKGKDGYELDEHAVKAIGIVGADWLANKLEPELAEHRTDDAIKTMLGLDRKEIVTPDMREEVSQFDTLYNHSVNRMGSQIYQLLGLKAKKGGDHIAGKRIEATMKTELGILAMKAIEYSKDKEHPPIVTTGVASYTINGTKYENVHVVKTNKVYDKNGDALIVVKGQSVKSEAKALDKLSKDAAGTKAKRGVYTSRLLAVPTDDEIVNDGITGMLGNVVSEDHKVADKKQSGTGNKLRKGYGIAVAKLAGDGVLQKAMGFVPESDTIDVLKPSSRGRNRQIEETIDYLQEAIKEFGYDTTLFAKWKVITNNRFMIDSNELNWQDKKLHRFAVTPTETNDGKPISVLVNTDLKHKLFHMMLAQAFDLPIDKREATIILEGGEVLNKDEKSIYTVINEVNKHIGKLNKEELQAKGINSLDEYLDSKLFTEQVEKAFILITNEYNDSEPEHALSGIVELLRYNVAKELNEAFYTDALIETDAITSGYGIKNMQMPVIVNKDGSVNKEATLAEMEKVGVFDVTPKTEKEKKRIKEGKEEEKVVPASYGKRVQDGKLDSYQDPAQGVAKRIAKEKIDVPRALMDIIDPKAIYNESDKLVSLSRAFMKNPFMVLNYGAGMTTINTAITRNAVNNLYLLVNKLYQIRILGAKGPLLEAEKVKANELETSIKRVFDAIGVPLDTNRLEVNNLKTFKLTNTELNKIYTKLMPASEDKPQTIGNAVEKEFDSKYGHFIKLVNLTNETLTMQFKVAKEMLDQKIRDRFKDLTTKYGNEQLVPPISREEMMTMVQELKDVFPVLDSALKMADGKPAPILIAKKKAVTSEDAAVELLGNTTATGAVKHASSTVFGKKYRTVTNAAIEVYKLVEAYSSGAVVPIHFFDGGVQAKVLSEYTALGVHDANFFTLDDVINGTKFYNENWYEMNKSYSLMDSMMKAFNGTFGKDSKALRDAIEAVVSNPANNSKDIKGNTVTFLDGVIAKSKELEAAMKKVNAGREFVYSRDLRIEHSYFPEVDGSSAAYEGKQGGLKTGKEKLGAGLSEMVKDGFAEKMTEVAEQASKNKKTKQNYDKIQAQKKATDKINEECN